MTNQPRTRAEIQAEIEKLENEIATLEAGLEEAWPKDGDTVYLKGTVRQSDDYIVDVQIEGDGDTFQIAYSALISAADLIPRAEHERAVLEANTRTDKVVLHLNARDAVGYLVKEYDLDTGHMDTVGPRTYPFDHNGHIYEVVVRRKAAAASQPTAVAPQGVVEELKSALRSMQVDRELDELAFQTGLAKALLALNRITELPEPSEWAREYVRRVDNGQLRLTPKLRLAHAAALLESEADGD